MLDTVGDLIWNERYEDAYNILIASAIQLGGQRGKLDNQLFEMLSDGVKESNINKGVKRGKYIMEPADVLYERILRRGFVPDYRIPKKEKIRIVSDNDVLCLNMHFYADVLTRCGKGYLIEKYMLFERCEDFKLLKKISIYALKSGPVVPDFNYLVGIENLAGYNVEVSGLSSLKEIREWVNNNFKPTLDGSPGNYLVSFRKEVRRLLRYRDGGLASKCDLRTFCGNIANTGTSGSAFDPGGPLPVFDLFGLPLKFSKNKFSKSAALSVDNKIARALSHEPALHKVNDKLEVIPKRRLIVSADYDLTLKMRFIDTWLSEWLHGCSDSSLWRNSMQKEEMWMNFMNYETRRWHVPIDQSAFDHHVSKDMVMIVIEEIKQIIIDRMISSTPGEKRDYLEVMDAIFDSMLYGKIVYELRPDDEGYIKGERTFITFDWGSGVLSGWQWTSKINTIVNIAEGNISMCRTMEKGVSLERLQFDATGDDQNTSWRYLIDGLLYWLDLTKSGYVIHPSKNFFSTKHNEYLRMYSTEEGINGYPARVINKMLWKYPGLSGTNNILAKVNEIYDRWERLRLRMRSEWSNIGDLMLMDYRNSKLDKRIINLILYNNVLDGGREIKWGPVYKSILLEKKQLGHIPGTWKYHINIQAIGFRQFQELYGLGQISEMNDWILNVCGVSDNQDGKELKTEDIYFDKDTELIPALPFAIVANVQNIPKPQFSKGWSNNTLFSTRDEVMEIAFPKIDVYKKIWHAPKTWVYDWIVGRVTLQYPKMTRISAAGAKMLCQKFENSAYYAMFKKRARENKWQALQRYYYNNMSVKMTDQIGDKMFCI